MVPISLSKAETQSSRKQFRELIPLFYAESANQHSLQSVQPPSILHPSTKKNLDQSSWFFFATFAHLGIFQKMKQIIHEYTFAI